MLILTVRTIYKLRTSSVKHVFDDETQRLGRKGKDNIKIYRLLIRCVSTRLSWLR